MRKRFITGNSSGSGLCDQAVALTGTKEIARNVQRYKRKDVVRCRGIQVFESNNKKLVVGRSGH